MWMNSRSDWLKGSVSFRRISFRRISIRRISIRRILILTLSLSPNPNPNHIPNRIEIRRGEIRRIEIRRNERSPVEIWIGLEQNSIDTAINEWRNRPCACVRAKGRHFEHLL